MQSVESQIVPVGVGVASADGEVDGVTEAEAEADFVGVGTIDTPPVGLRVEYLRLRHWL